MELSLAAKAFEALAHETRLAIFSLLLPAGQKGLPAGTIGKRLGLAPNTLSFHLSRLAIQVNGDH
ncbi:MAG: helix-turn-helix transcriptional regulator, partial [Proteobacteria bacterium]|nr:helix-turn-helix transcriptional regulator [Pseudomonadota bacterium]